MVTPKGCECLLPLVLEKYSAVENSTGYRILVSSASAGLSMGQAVVLRKYLRLSNMLSFFLDRNHCREIISL